MHCVSVHRGIGHLLRGRVLPHALHGILREQHRIDKAAAKLEMREWTLAKKAVLQEDDAGGDGDPEAGRRPGKKTQAEWTNEWTPAQDSLLKQKCLCFRNIYVKV